MKTLFVLAVLGMIAGIIWQLVPAWYERYEVGLGMACTLETATVEMTDDEVRQILIKCLAFQKQDTEHPAQKFSIRRARDPRMGKDRIMLDYTFVRDIGLPGTSMSYPLSLSLTR